MSFLLNRLRWLLCLTSLALAGCSDAPDVSGFAGLDDPADEDRFAQPAPGDRLRFPEDFGPHPAHRIEWWYLTANLVTDEGEPLGLQWTQFRQGLVPRPPGRVANSGLAACFWAS